MNRREILKSLTAMVLIATLAFPLAGCPSQTQLAVLTQTFGSAASQIAALQGNPSLAAKLTADTTAAVAAINNWKQGTSSQIALQALNLVMDDLNLIPAAGPYAALIDLAIVTAESIIIILQPTGGIAAHTARAHSATPPAKTASEFKKRWNALAPDSQSKIK
jgi:hypothetical protein